MNNINSWVVSDDHGNPILFLWIDPGSKPNWVDVYVDEYDGWDPETLQPVNLERIVKASVKWDGCIHWNFGYGEIDSPYADGYLHTCGHRGWQKLQITIQYVAEVAAEFMGAAWGEGDLT